MMGDTPFVLDRKRLWDFGDLINCEVVLLMQAYEQMRGLLDWLHKAPDHNIIINKNSPHKYASHAFFEDLKRMDEVINDTRIRWDLNHLQSRLGSLGGMTLAVFIHELSSIKNDLVLVISERKFAYIPSEVAPYFQQEKLFGDWVYERFPKMRDDIRDAETVLLLTCLQERFSI